jgi:hypothetical protein
MKILLTISFLIFLSACAKMPFSKNEKPIIHSGHFLKSNLSKSANMEVLETMENKNYVLVNLTLDDLLIAKAQGINFRQYPKLIFLNSSIIDLDKDNLYNETNVISYYILNGVCFIGLSDLNFDRKIISDHFMIDDYVLSILKIKNSLKKENPASYVIIHNLGKDYENLLNRLPEDFKALLTN